jgi:hypothetical protein
MRSLNTRGMAWRKSSYSAANGNCVEVGRLVNGRIGIRDSKDLSAPALGFSSVQWRAFIGEVKLERQDRA